MPFGFLVMLLFYYDHVSFVGALRWTQISNILPRMSAASQPKRASIP